MYSWEPSLNEENRKELWKIVMEKGRQRETKTTHELSEDQLTTVLASTDFFVQDGSMGQVYFDLAIARYKIYDWIAMLLDGRDNGHDRLTQVMTSAYLRSNDIEGFIHNLQDHDYQIEEPILEPIREGSGDIELTLDDKRALVEHARGSPEIEDEVFFSKVYGRKLPISAVKGLCPACGEPIMDDEKASTIDQELAVNKENYCGYDGFESNDDELVKEVE